jgi:hypothetical protein
VSPVRYGLGFYITAEDILHSHRREHLKSYIALTGWTLKRRRNVSPVNYGLGFYYKFYYILIVSIPTSFNVNKIMVCPGFKLKILFYYALNFVDSWRSLSRYSSLAD